MRVSDRKKEDDPYPGILLPMEVGLAETPPQTGSNAGNQHEEPSSGIRVSPGVIPIPHRTAGVVFYYVLC